MATPNIELTQFPSSQFSQYSVDSPPHFAHLLIQSSDPVLKMTHVIGDTVKFKIYPAPYIFLGMKQTALVDDNEARREYEAEFEVPGILPSTTQPPISFHLQLQNQIQRDYIHLPVRALARLDLIPFSSPFSLYGLSYCMPELTSLTSYCAPS